MDESPQYSAWFQNLTGNPPYEWQAQLANAHDFSSRLIRIPTGFGKTQGILGAWTYNRVIRRDKSWPRRLVLCLPMRVLVEQTEAVVRESLQRVGLLREAGQEGDGVAVHLLMGGAGSSEWHLDIEGDAVLVGTQDMLLSRALNRGFAASRARWPVEFGLLTQDALWVLDEVQLMDVGLATSAQVEAFIADAPQSLRPFAAWWMSATMQRSWLRSVDTVHRVDGIPEITIPPTSRQGHLWDDVHKPVQRVEVVVAKKDLAKAIADEVLKAWLPEADRTDGPGSDSARLGLVVVNTVDRARDVFAVLQAHFKKDPQAPELRLVHSRFRPAERASWRNEFLNRGVSLPANGRLIVATQVVEAGVDLDADVLVTELAPWPSLVQRFGRAARGGGTADIVVFDPMFDDDKLAAPYVVEALEGARSALEGLGDVSPLSLEAFEEQLPPDDLASLYPYRPAHLLLRSEVDELFDTTPDLTGADLDVSRFIRSGEERDVVVAWMPFAKDAKPDSRTHPAREALCAVPFLRARDWLCGTKSERLREGVRAWVWDYLDGEWRLARASAILPGRTLIVAAEVGGYDPVLGFDPKAKRSVPEVVATLPSDQDLADASQDAEELSEFSYKTIATHGEEVAAKAMAIADALGLPTRYAHVLNLAGLWHDVGKAHPAFQGSMRADDRPVRNDLAKAPNGAWKREYLYRDVESGERRPGFRHELASALALFAIVEATLPGHDALLGMLRSFFEVPEGVRSPTAAEAAVLSLSPEDFDLLAYLVASHHGKVRGRLHAAPVDQEYLPQDGRGQPIRGVREGDRLPEIAFGEGILPSLGLSLEPAALGLSPRMGRSWTDRVEGLVRSEGPFVLGLLEATLRAADVVASRLTTSDRRVVEEVV